MSRREISIVSTASGGLSGLTLNGISAIKNADLIIYDQTIDPSLDSLFDPDTQLIPGPLHTLTEARTLEMEIRSLSEAIRKNRKVVRLIVERPHTSRHLESELKFLRRLGLKYRFLPSRAAFENEARQLKLPWLLHLNANAFRIIESTAIKGGRGFWQDLAQKTDTLAVDLGKDSLHIFVDRLLMAGADPERPVALVAHHPTRDPVCWLTTLNEVDEIWPQWKTSAATILYIGTWPHRVGSLDYELNFWGHLAGAADQWLRNAKTGSI